MFVLNFTRRKQMLEFDEEMFKNFKEEYIKVKKHVLKKDIRVYTKNRNAQTIRKRYCKSP